MGFGRTYADTLNTADFFTADVALTKDAWIELGRKTLTPGEAYDYGQGSYGGQDSATGRLYVNLQTAADAAITGKIRLNILDENDNLVETVAEFDLGDLATSATDRRQQRPFPRIAAAAIPYFKLQLQVKADATATAAVAKSVLKMNMTRYQYSF